MQRQARTAAPLSYSFSDRISELFDIREREIKIPGRVTRARRLFSLWSPRTVSLFGQEPKREMGLDLRNSYLLSSNI